jgi:hypothetical protein
VLIQKDQENFLRTGIRRCWFIKSTEEVFLEIKKNQEYLNLIQPRTFDFTTMYTNLKHERIISNLESRIKEARDYINKMPTKKQEELNMVLKSDLNIMEHVCFIVKNTYLCTKEGVLRHQEIGLPMGTNCAPELANLTLYHDEAAYIGNLVHINEDIAKRHCHSFQFIDDMYYAVMKSHLHQKFMA